MATRTSVDGRRSKPPPLQIPRPSTAPHAGTPLSRRLDTPTTQPDTTPDTTSAQPKEGHQRFVLTDPVAFRYLEDDPSTTVLERRRELQGYECYIVEQWTTSRTHPTFVITTYTGDPAHVVVVDVLSVPTDETTWSPRLRVYFKALNQYHARRRETPLGTLMVTNLSAFPSSLTVIPVPDGDLKKHRFDFFVNENLKRLGCSGRVGLTLVPPSGATAAKFHQLYKTSDKIEIYKSVIELVKLCQSALMLFNKLEIDYADGLLCDVTERAINDWWVEVGSDQYGIEPHDGILGPTTVAGLLGSFMGARNRLHSVGAPVTKDAFDVDAMKRGISAFQKQQRIPRTRRLDRRTLDRLQKATAKAASSEGWTVPRAVKSTVAELSGKGGEMVMDVVGRRDKAGIAEIETTDIERFVQLAYGERCKWLWYGKPLKKAKSPERLGGPGLVFTPDEHGGFTWTGRKSTTDDATLPNKQTRDNHLSPVVDYADTSGDEEQKSNLFKRATGLKNEAKSKIKGAVTLKSHHYQQRSPTKEDLPHSPNEDRGSQHKRPNLDRAATSPLSSPNSPNSVTQEQTLFAALTEQRSSRTAPRRSGSHHRQSGSTKETVNVGSAPTHGKQPHATMEEQQRDYSDHASDIGSEPGTVPSIAGSEYHGVDLDEVLPTGKETGHKVPPLLRRTLSHSHIFKTHWEAREPDHFPRHLSFSLAEESVLTWRTLSHDDYEPHSSDELSAQLAHENFLASESKTLRLAIDHLSLDTAEWTQNQLRTLRTLLEDADSDQQKLDASYRPHLRTVQGLQTDTDGVLREEKERLVEGGKELETLAAKLEYEIAGLKSRIEDVEAGVEDFEKGVGRVEDRVTELEKDNQNKPGWSCVVC